MPERNTLPQKHSPPSRPPPWRPEHRGTATRPRWSPPPAHSARSDPHHGGSQYSRIEGALHPPPERRHQSTPKAEALHHGTPSPPPQTHVASPPGGLPDLTAKRPKECLLQGREGFNNHQTHRHDDHQPPDPTATDAGMVNQRRDHAPNLVGRQRRSASPPLQSSTGSTNSDQY
jgi:hypothetical protein